jgi:hypothetical protein
VIRPQWKYNWKYVPITRELQDLIVPAALDPNSELSASSKADILPALWKWYCDRVTDPSEKERLGSVPPTQLAILSFAGLDTHDSLLYPLLAHELGHFIDYSYKDPLSLSSEITTASYIAHADVEAIVTANAGHLVNRVDDIWKNIVLRVGVCVRELLADSLALRMTGFGFFAAQAEFLKTIVGWPQTLLTPSGYPGIKFRIWSVFRQLIETDFPANPREFLKNNNAPAGLTLSPVVQYLEAWEERVKYGADLNVPPTSNRPATLPAIVQRLEELAENAVLKTLPTIAKVAKETIPNDRCPQLTARFYDRVSRLERDLPPSTATEAPQTFAEILSAAWAYQLCFGKERELNAPDSARKYAEYQKTCRLVLKAIELIPTSEQEPVPVFEPALDELGAVLAAPHLRRRISTPVTDPSHLAVIPLSAKSIQAASMDVHLGNWFVVMRRTRLKSVRINDPADQRLLKIVGREETFIRDGETFLIHPGDGIQDHDAGLHVQCPGRLVADLIRRRHRAVPSTSEVIQRLAGGGQS